MIKFNNLRPKFKVIIVIIVIMAIISVISIALAIIMYDSGDNHTLNSIEAATQKVIQDKADNSDIKLLKILVESDDGWKLSQINLRSDHNNRALVITHNDNIVIGPTTNPSADDLVNNSVPDSIVSYLYPDKPYWINFTDAFSSSLKDSSAEVKGVIQAYAYVNHMTLDKVTLVSDITRNVENPREENRAETLQFNFTINDNPEQYTFKSIYAFIDGKYTYQVINSQGQVVYSSTP